MIELSAHQFELIPDERDSYGVPFGIGPSFADRLRLGDTVVVTPKISVNGEGGFDPGDAEWATQDVTNPTRGTTMFGRDQLLGPTWTWSMHTNMEDEDGAVEALGELGAAWRAHGIRDTPGAMSVVRYRIAGRTRRVYGRPQRWAAPPSNRILGGYVPVTADFKCADAYTYSDEEYSATMSLADPSEGGWTFPTTFPVQTERSSQRDGSLRVGGDADTYGIFLIEGPVTNPIIETDWWTLKLNMTIDSLTPVVIDTRPWALTVKRGEGSVANKLGPRQYLSDVTLRPGLNDIRFAGTSSTGGARLTVSWRSRHNSL